MPLILRMIGLLRGMSLCLRTGGGTAMWTLLGVVATMGIVLVLVSLALIALSVVALVVLLVMAATTSREPAGDQVAMR